jgi:hypothetical protein
MVKVWTKKISYGPHLPSGIVFETELKTYYGEEFFGEFICPRTAGGAHRGHTIE